MDKVFVDTSFFIALLNSRDADHPHAVQLQEELASLKTRKTTSEFILLELCDGLAKLSHRELAIQVIELLKRDGLLKSSRPQAICGKPDGAYTNPVAIKNGG